jgi:hypothetical protein
LKDIIKPHIRLIIPCVALIFDFRARSVEGAIMFAWTFMFLHTGALAIIKETTGALTAGFTFC